MASRRCPVGGQGLGLEGADPGQATPKLGRGGVVKRRQRVVVWDTSLPWEPLDKGRQMR